MAGTCNGASAIFGADGQSGLAGSVPAEMSDWGRLRVPLFHLSELDLLGQPRPTKSIMTESIMRKIALAVMMIAPLLLSSPALADSLVGRYVADILALIHI